MSLRPIPKNSDCQKWQAGFNRSDNAELCLRYALAFNTLDAGWLKGVLSPHVTYGSQSVLETMAGKSRVWDYIKRKIDTLKRYPNQRPRCELATSSEAEPCVLLFQPENEYDQHWLELPLASVMIKSDDRGRALEIFMVTVAPPPTSAKRSGIYPGAEENALPLAKKIGVQGGNYKGMRLIFFFA